MTLDTAARRIDFDLCFQDARLACLACGTADQPVHGRLARSWRHLDFFQYEVWLHSMKGVRHGLPAARIGFDRFHVIQMATRVMDEVRRAELGDRTKAARRFMWGMRCNPVGWKKEQVHAMHWLQRSSPKSVRAWRLKMTLQQVYAQAPGHDNEQKASRLLERWIRCARCRLAPFKRLAGTLRDRLSRVVRSMPAGRFNAYGEAMNGQLQLAKHAARGVSASENFIAIAYLRISKLKHLPQNPLQPAAR